MALSMELLSKRSDYGVGRVLRILFLLLIVAPAGQSLMCYFCAATSPNTNCEHIINAEDSPVKNCTSPHDDFCIIETFISRGEISSLIRDCNNGSTFSFGTSAVYKRLYDLTESANNETACVYSTPFQVCLSICKGDLCNGPRLEDVNGARALWVNWSAAVHVGILLPSIARYLVFA